MKPGSKLSVFMGLCMITFAGQSLAADDTTSSALRSDKTWSVALIDGVRVDGGALVGWYVTPDTLLEASYIEEKNLFVGDAASSEYNSQSKSFDLGVKRFFGNSFFTSLAVRQSKTDSNNNNYNDPQITLWHKDIMGRLALGNQWQLIEGVSIGVEWLSLGSTIRRLDRSSEARSPKIDDVAQANQAVRDEKKANRFFYSTLNLQLGYSF